MYVEDLVFQLAALDVKWSPWQGNFIASVSDRVQTGRPLSIKQAAVLLDLVRQNRDRLRCDALDTLLIEPKYRIEPYRYTPVQREVRHLGSNRLALRFPPDDIARETIKQLKPASGTAAERPRFNRKYNIWVVCVDRQTLYPLLLLIENQQFAADAATLDYLALAEQSRDQPSTAVLTADNAVIRLTVRDNPWLACWALENAAGIDL